MGIERRTHVGRFREYIEVMRLLWAGGLVTYHGKYVTLDDASLSLRPRSPDGIPLRIGSTVEAVVQCAAELSDSWQGAGAMSMDELKRWWSLFHETRVALGKSLDYPRQVLRKCFRGSSMAMARAVAMGPLAANI